MMIPMPWKVKKRGRYVNTIDLVWNLVYTAIPHTPDIKNYWRTPEETLCDGKGDCEDKAILALAICNLKRIRAVMIGGLIKNPNSEEKYGHTWLETPGGKRVENHLFYWEYQKPPGTFRADSILQVAKFQQWPWYYRWVWQVWLWLTGI